MRESFESETSQPLPAGMAAGLTDDPAFLASVNETARRVAAVDDAWIACVVLLEKLQSPALAPEETTALLADLASCYGRYRQALQPIERLIAGGCSAGRQPC